MLLTLRLCVLYGSHNKQRLLPSTALADCFCIMRWRVFTVRYALSHYKQQTSLAFRELNLVESWSAFGHWYLWKLAFLSKFRKSIKPHSLQFSIFGAMVLLNNPSFLQSVLSHPLKYVYMRSSSTSSMSLQPCAGGTPTHSASYA